MAHRGKQNQEKGRMVLSSRYPAEVLAASRDLGVLLNEASSSARHNVMWGHLTEMMNWAHISLFCKKSSAVWAEEAAVAAGVAASSYLEKKRSGSTTDFRLSSLAQLEAAYFCQNIPAHPTGKPTPVIFPQPCFLLLGKPRSSSVCGGLEWSAKIMNALMQMLK